MKIIFNGESVELSDSISVEAFIASRKLDPAKVLVEYNSRIIDRAEWPGIILRNADNVFVLSFVGGG